MTTEEKLARIQQFVTEFNQNNLEKLSEYLATDFFNYSPGADEPNAAEVIYGFLSDFRAASSDLRLSFDNLAADGDLLRGQMSMHGGHDGPLWGVPATGKQFDMTVDVAIRDIDGRFALAVENIVPPQALAIMRQVELVPERMDRPPKHPVVHPEILLKVVFTGQVADKPCSHLHLIQVMEPATHVCQQCVESGDIWPALRMCLVCGFVGCCDTSVNKHMKAHYEETGHPIFRSIRLQESWGWCYEDNAFLMSRVIRGES